VYSKQVGAERYAWLFQCHVGEFECGETELVDL